MLRSTLLLLSKLFYCISATQLRIENAGFEMDGYPIPNNTFYFEQGVILSISNWTLYDPSNLLGEGSIGVQNPSLGTTYNDSLFESNAPQGHQQAYITAAPSGSNVTVHDVGIQQTLTDHVEANITYTLTVWIGNPGSNCWSNQTQCYVATPFPGYRVQLLAQDTILVQDNNTLNITTRTWQKSTITVTTAPHDPSIGKALKIRLINKNNAKMNQSGNVDFDDVCLEATSTGATPIQSTIYMVNTSDTIQATLQDTRTYGVLQLIVLVPFAACVVIGVAVVLCIFCGKEPGKESQQSDKEQESNQNVKTFGLPRRNSTNWDDIQQVAKDNKIESESRLPSSFEQWKRRERPNNEHIGRVPTDSEDMDKGKMPYMDYVEKKKVNSPISEEKPLFKEDIANNGMYVVALKEENKESERHKMKPKGPMEWSHSKPRSLPNSKSLKGMTWINSLVISEMDPNEFDMEMNPMARRLESIETIHDVKKDISVWDNGQWSQRYGSQASEPEIAFAPFEME